uniref:Uncharacterized protein n=1 Tax=Amphora coffeiformis TaxID=265554 RepID=A0A7S3P820_9STRA|mmetsp:Transcript_17437/g.33090  ORF Transcript_17437/g.33090 Transcript_17437/m.33090 type:complete len:310 (+) Transcript_17437:131-1060(+)|eukprot:scaffold2383_cov161-Amphora_coffeaeformis.AAC.37
MAQNQIALSDEDDDEEQHAHVALVMRDTISPSYQTESCTTNNVDPQKPTEGIVWAEARVAPPTGSENPQQQLPPEVIAVSQVVVIPVEIDNETLTTDVHTTTSRDSADSMERHEFEEVHHDLEAAAVQEDDDDGMMSVPPAPTTCSLYRWNFLVFVFGNSLLLAATATTLGIEICGSVVYMLGALFYWAAEGFSKVGHWTLLFQTIFRLLSVLLLSIDLILLTISAVLVELLAWIAGILCILFGGIHVGVGMHQHIRLVCQLMRTVYRKFHVNWNPQRMEPYIFQENDEVNDTHVNSFHENPRERVVLR